MAGYLETSAQDIESLQGSGGSPFREFMKQLLRSHCYALGIPSGDVISDSENMADGGCDAQVRGDAVADTTGYLSVPTCWQFKGTPKDRITEKILREEVQKRYARKLLSDGYGYRLAIADDLSTQAVADKEAILTDEIRKINGSAPAPIVLSSTSVAQWASRYPALTLWRKGKAGSLLTLPAWGEAITAETKVYVRNKDWAEVEAIIRRHLDFNFAGSTVSIRVRGPAGVGKSRCTYETIVAIVGVIGLSLYTMDERQSKIWPMS